MTIYPAIDIKDGRCVRLLQGDMDRATQYGDPVEAALRWKEQGAQWLHVVDLNGAFRGAFVNREAVSVIVRKTGLPVQTGGGIRTREDIRVRLEDVGVSRVVIGTAALEDPELVRWAADTYGERIAVGLDARSGMLAARGWAEETQKAVLPAARSMHEMGVSWIIYTDIAKDGMMEGPDMERTGQLIRGSGCMVIASGGITTIEDIETLKGLGAAGCILGKALFEGALSLPEAIRAGASC